jgi:serine/threonine protein phosphatase 1
MRLFAVGDIHGCQTAFDVILSAIHLQPGDKIICLGDYINKGPETSGVIDRLIQLHNKGVLIPLLGNHELKWKLARKLQQPRRGAEVLIDSSTLESYGSPSQPGRLESIPEQHWRFVEEACLAWFTTEDYIFTHANLDQHKPLVDQPSSALFWDKFRDPKPHCSGKTMVCGHTPQRDGNPINLGHAICLDTAACEGHWLTCLEVYSGEVWQANQLRELRHAHIHDYYVNVGEESLHGTTPRPELSAV